MQDLAAVSKVNVETPEEVAEEGATGEAAPKDAAEEGFPHEIFGMHTGI